MNMIDIKTTHLNIREMLPVIRKAFDNKELQMFKESKGGDRQCLYAGPCVIGICVPEDIRDDLDHFLDDTSASSYFGMGIFTTNNEDEQNDIGELQSYHDSAVIAYYDEARKCRIDEFGVFLKNLEEKYQSS